MGSGRCVDIVDSNTNPLVLAPECCSPLYKHTLSIYQILPTWNSVPILRFLPFHLTPISRNLGETVPSQRTCGRGTMLPSWLCLKTRLPLTTISGETYITHTHWI